MIINIPASIGEVVDKLTILEIKKQKISEKEKLDIIHYEYLKLEKILNESNILGLDKTKEFFKELYIINLELWEIEDKIRICEKKKNFGEEFLELARNVYITNDKRFSVKNEINLYFGSDIKEVKDYEEY